MREVRPGSPLPLDFSSMFLVPPLLFLFVIYVVLFHQPDGQWIGGEFDRAWLDTFRPSRLNSVDSGSLWIHLVYLRHWNRYTRVWIRYVACRITILPWIFLKFGLLSLWFHTLCFLRRIVLLYWSPSNYTSFAISDVQRSHEQRQNKIKSRVQLIKWAVQSSCPFRMCHPGPLEKRTYTKSALNIYHTHYTFPDIRKMAHLILR